MQSRDSLWVVFNGWKTVGLQLMIMLVIKYSAYYFLDELIHQLVYKMSDNMSKANVQSQTQRCPVEYDNIWRKAGNLHNEDAENNCTVCIKNYFDDETIYYL